MGNNNAHARASTALLSTTALPSFNAFVAAATAAGAQCDAAIGEYEHRGGTMEKCIAAVVNAKAGTAV